MLVKCFGNLALDILAYAGTQGILVVEDVRREGLLMTVSISPSEDGV